MLLRKVPQIHKVAGYEPMYVKTKLMQLPVLLGSHSSKPNCNHFSIYVLSHLIFTATLRERYRSRLHSAEEETDTERLRHLPKVTQLESRADRK